VETNPPLPVGYGQPLQHDDSVYVLGKHRVTDVIRQPLVKLVLPVSLLVLG